MISIIIPVYNSAPYIGIALESILSQRYNNYEVIIIDDGSTDDSLKIAESYSMASQSVRVFHKENGGVSSARNYGLEKASGEFVMFLDSDDRLPEGALDILMDGMTERIDLVMAGYEIFNADGSLNYSVSTVVRKNISPRETMEQMFSPSPYRYEGFIGGKLYRRSIIEQYHIRFDESIYFNEDRLFAVQYISHQKGETFFDTTPVYDYYLWPNSAMGTMSSTFHPKFMTDFTAVKQMTEIVRKTFHDKYLTELARKELFDSFLRIYGRMKHSGSVDNSSLLKLMLRMVISIPIFSMIKFTVGFATIKRQNV